MNAEQRIAAALDIARRYSQIDGAHHKAWTIDMMVRLLTGDEYDDWIDNYCNGGDYEWDKGVAP